MSTLLRWVPRDARKASQVDVRALVIVEAVWTEPLSIAELARRLSISASTAWAWTRLAVDAGFVRQEGRGRSARIEVTPAARARLNHAHAAQEQHDDGNEEGPEEGPEEDEPAHEEAAEGAALDRA